MGDAFQFDGEDRDSVVPVVIPAATQILVLVDFYPISVDEILTRCVCWAVKSSCSAIPPVLGKRLSPPFELDLNVVYAR